MDPLTPKRICFISGALEGLDPRAGTILLTFLNSTATSLLYSSTVFIMHKNDVRNKSE
jgi:hypothetical protein